MKEFQLVDATLALSVPPVFTNKPTDGVKELLDSLVMRYVPALQGVLLTHSDLSFLTKTARIINECPFLVCNVAFKAMVWRPIVGMRLVAKISLSSPDHISLLVHRTFNASIPKYHIQTDQFEFEYGPLENDPEFAPKEGETVSTGRWVHKLTNDPLGGKDGFLEFTVVGLTVANEMLSLVGSLHSDPFDPSHVPSTSITCINDEEDLDEIVQERQPDDDEEEEEDEEDELDSEDQSKAPSPVPLKKSSKRKNKDEEHSAPKAKKKKGDEDIGRKKRKKGVQS